ncbi:DUF262 domain-containing protein [Bacteroides sp. OF04-15BH]|jgi:hypothetical protein|uniref:DUF262 domain-containing protein n=1 Tax=Bacteroides sp. OF04-15BH TaxID=2292281 RepID=UPI000E554357|nr:DUF262 domain-containing protein [Bacteroides sp. OF04-15BH]RHP66641.1 DUF262 domain-containing protein [Bacteroides sp. OF04-15BH]
MVEELKILGEQVIFNTDAHYVIPRYQRAYAWEDKEIEQLIDDINDINASENYYIGSLVVSKVKGKFETYEVVDGQQRLTTLFLLLQYLVYVGALKEEVGQTLSFDCRSNSNYTLSHIQKILAGQIEDENSIELSILNGIKVIRQKFEKDTTLNIDNFVSCLGHVILYRIEVPEHTDLNRYFEIMNTRGEQLEQHDILKAQLMGCLNDRGEQEFFSKIWNACSDMTGYVQMHFSPFYREKIFGNEWNDWPADEWADYQQCFCVTEESDKGATIAEIVSSKFKIDDIDGMLDNNIHVRFDSIIDFPYFLLHTLRVFVELNEVSLEKPLGDLLDDKKLISDFKNVVDQGKINGNSIDKEVFAQMFIIHLLQTRYLFDRFIIKREYTGEDNEGEWSLKELFTSGQGSKKKAYYSNTKLNYSNEWERTYAPRNKECLMIQSALRVSYTSPKVMHWITELILWLFNNDDNQNPKLIDVAVSIAAQATLENFLNGGNYKLGVQTPHIVFNFLDYLLWKSDKNKYGDFDFEFRNSVEHWYPQNPSDGSFDSWDNKDTFGNLCIISRSVNSKFSNLSPKSKMQSYEKMIKKGSLKLRIMGDIIRNNSNESWIMNQCEEHEDEMINLLKDACAMQD